MRMDATVGDRCCRGYTRETLEEKNEAQVWSEVQMGGWR